jgi:hypothetical protein
MSQYGGSNRKPSLIKGTGDHIKMIQGMGPFLPQGAAKNVARPMYKGKPRPTGVFDA